MTYVPPSWGSEPPTPPPPAPKWRKPPIDRSVLILVAIFAVIGVLAWYAGKLKTENLIAYGVIIPSIILHEISHGWLASRFGDQTAKLAGRLTLNPLRHVDSFGTFIMPAFLALSGVTPLGYAKPVPVNVSRMSPNKAMFTSLIGPFTNIVIALIAAAALRFYLPTVSSGAVSDTDYWIYIAIVALGYGNMHLAIFNLIPIPPLDGSAVVERFIPRKYLPQYLELRKYSMAFLVLLFLVGFRYISGIFEPFDDLWAAVAGDV